MHKSVSVNLVVQEVFDGSPLELCGSPAHACE